MFLCPNRVRTLFVAILWVLHANAPLNAADRLQVVGATMGTRYAVTIDTPSATITEDALREQLEERLVEINALMSTWDDASEISRFNRNESIDWIDVSAELLTVVAEAKRIHGLTDGGFDPTVSPLIDLWGFGKPGRLTIPNDDVLQEVRASIGLDKVEIRTEPPALRKQVPRVQLNLSAIAKGYAVDQLAELLEQIGEPSFVVDIGGETRAGAAKASGEPWRIGVESPDAGLTRGKAPSRITELTFAAIATSGDYRNRYVVDGRSYSHTIDPGTGRPVLEPPASVSVRSDSCMTADAVATGMMVLGRERGLTLAHAQGWSVLFQTLNDDGTIVESGTGTFGTESLELSADETHLDSSPKSELQSDEWVVFALAGVVFLVAVGGMAVGIILSNREIKGSCGGLASMPGNDGKSICELCTIPRDECVNEELRQQMKAGSQVCEESADC